MKFAISSSWKFQRKYELAQQTCVQNEIQMAACGNSSESCNKRAKNKQQTKNKNQSDCNSTQRQGKCKKTSGQTM